MPKLRVGRSVWLDRSSTIRRTRYPTLRGELSVDVAIVGGGITAAVAAYFFSEAGIRVAVLEADRVASGSTAASTALLMQEPDKDLCELGRRYGRKRARATWRALYEATGDCLATIRQLKIDCDLHERQSVYYTLDTEKVQMLRQEYRERRRARLPARWLSARRLYRLTGIHGAAGIATPCNGQVDPIKACRGFLHAAVARGAKVFEHSKVGHIRQLKAGLEIRAGRARVHANCVLIATGYATPQFRPLTGRFRMRETFVIATRRLDRATRRGLNSSGVMAWDTDKPYHYLRWTDDGRLLIGGQDVDYRSKRGARTRLRAGCERLTTYLARMYPTLAPERIEYCWGGLFAETPDGLPYIGVHRRYPRHLFALGYGGNGMSASFLGARLLLQRYRRLPVPEEKLFSFSRMNSR